MIQKKEWKCPQCNSIKPPKGYSCPDCKIKFDTEYKPVEPLHPSQHMGDTDFEGMK